VLSDTFSGVMRFQMIWLIVLFPVFTRPSLQKGLSSLEGNVVAAASPIQDRLSGTGAGVHTRSPTCSMQGPQSAPEKL
jgi:hypothetical protein